MKTFSTIKRYFFFVLPLFILVFSVLLLKFPTLYGLTTEKVTLVVLALIGVEFLLEKLCYLEQLPEMLAKIAKLEAQSKIFGHRGDFGSTADMIRTAKKKLFVSGITLDAMVHNIELLEEKAKEKVTIRLLPIEPNPELISQCSVYLGENDTANLEKLDANLRILYERLQAKYPRSVEIRTLPHRPAFGYAVIDPHNGHGFIRVESYTCRSGPVSRPMMQFNRRNQNEEFTAYFDDFERLWSFALPLNKRDSKIISSTTKSRVEMGLGI